MDFADEVSIGGKDFDAVVFGIAPARAGPEVAVGVTTNAVGKPGGHLGKDASVFEGAIVYVKDANVCWTAQAVGCAGVGNIEDFFIGGKAEAVGAYKVVGYDGGVSGAGVEAVDVGRQFVFSDLTFVVEHDAITWIGEPDTAIGVDNDVVGGIEGFAFKAVDENGDRPVVFGAGDASGAVFAGDEAALVVAGVAIAKVGGLAKDTEGAVAFVPAHDAVVGNVAKEYTSRITKPNGTFTPAKACAKAINSGIADGVFLKAFV